MYYPERVGGMVLYSIIPEISRQDNQRSRKFHEEIAAGQARYFLDFMELRRYLPDSIHEMTVRTVPDSDGEVSGLILEPAQGRIWNIAGIAKAIEQEEPLIQVTYASDNRLKFSARIGRRDVIFHLKKEAQNRTADTEHEFEVQRGRYKPAEQDTVYTPKVETLIEQEKAEETTGIEPLAEPIDAEDTKDIEAIAEQEKAEAITDIEPEAETEDDNRVKGLEELARYSEIRDRDSYETGNLDSVVDTVSQAISILDATVMTTETEKGEKPIVIYRKSDNRVIEVDLMPSIDDRFTLVSLTQDAEPCEMQRRGVMAFQYQGQTVRVHRFHIEGKFDIRGSMHKRAELYIAKPPTEEDYHRVMENVCNLPFTIRTNNDTEITVVYKDDLTLLFPKKGSNITTTGYDDAIQTGRITEKKRSTQDMLNFMTPDGKEYIISKYLKPSMENLETTGGWWRPDCFDEYYVTHARKNIRKRLITSSTRIRSLSSTLSGSGNGQ
jgi:hypothetical protein